MSYSMYMLSCHLRLCVEGPADFSASDLLSSSAVISTPLVLDS